jgi:hypothetical protein
VGDDADPDTGYLVEESRDSTFEITTDLRQAGIHTTRRVETENDLDKPIGHGYPLASE